MIRALGRKPSRRDLRTLKLSSYLAPSQRPSAPMARDWSHPEHAPRWGMYGNDRVGCCTIAAQAHRLQAEAASAGHPPPTIADSDVLETYAAVSGWSSSRPDLDRGAQMIDALRWMSTRGLAGYKIGAFVAVNPQSRVEMQSAINLCGSAYVGVDLPTSAQTQTVWDVAPPGRHDATYENGSWGSHAVSLVGYDRLHVTLVTWGAVKIATVEWLMTYASEAWATLDDLWVRDDGLTPSGFDVASLRRDLEAIRAT